jgi:hypothetical protein
MAPGPDPVAPNPSHLPVEPEFGRDLPSDDAEASSGKPPDARSIPHAV